MTEIGGGRLVIETLKKAGVETIFGLHGAHIDPLFQACLDENVKIVDTRHEVAAGHAAEGYARATGRLGVAMVTAGPGFTNVVASMANAYLDRTPVLYLSGANGLSGAETNTLQAGIDQVAIARPVTKWAHQVTRTEQLPRLVAQAIRIAMTPPTGPVLLDLPMDVLGARIDAASVEPAHRLTLDIAAEPSSGSIAAILEKLAKAERPVLLLGGHWPADAAAAVTKLAETTSTPVYTDFFAHGLLPASHPLHGGTTHKMADLKDTPPDLILALGIRFGLFTLGTLPHLIPHGAEIIHVDTDGRELGRIRSADLALLADPAATASALAEAASTRSWPDRNAWVNRIATCRTERKRLAAADLEAVNPPLHPYQAVTAIAEALDDDTIVVGDGAEAYHWLNEVIARDHPHHYITHGFLGCVGMGLGLAIGAASSRADASVLALAGDGAVGFTLAEFDTMARHNLPITVVVMNNQSWAASQHFQELAVGRNRVVGTQLSGARYEDAAKALGCTGVYIDRAADLTPAIRAALASRKPTCINVAIDLAPLPPELHLLMAR